MSLHPEDTPEGCLPPFEVAKAYAFHVALEAIEEHLGKPAYALLGKRANSWIAEQLHVKGGGSPAERTVQQVVAKCKEPGWYLGQTKGPRTGRPPTFSDSQKEQVAKAAVALKKSSYKKVCPQSFQKRGRPQSLFFIC